MNLSHIMAEWIKWSQLYTTTRRGESSPSKWHSQYILDKGVHQNHYPAWSPMVPNGSNHIGTRQYHHHHYSKFPLYTVRQRIEETYPHGAHVGTYLYMGLSHTSTERILGSLPARRTRGKWAHVGHNFSYAFTDRRGLPVSRTSTQNHSCCPQWRQPWAGGSSRFTVHKCIPSNHNQVFPK